MKCSNGELEEGGRKGEEKKIKGEREGKEENCEGLSNRTLFISD